MVQGLCYGIEVRTRKCPSSGAGKLLPILQDQIAPPTVGPSVREKQTPVIARLVNCQLCVIRDWYTDERHPFIRPRRSGLATLFSYSPFH